MFIAFGTSVRADDGPKGPPPQRIITIAPNSAEIICALGACDAIIGVSKFCVYPPDLSSVPRVGGLIDPDIEKIIALRPDLIVLRGNSESLARVASDSGIPIYFDQTDSIDGIETCIKDLGVRLSLQERAGQLIAQFRRDLAAIAKRTHGKPRPSVLVTITRQSRRMANLLTAGKGTFLDEMITLAGGRNAFGDIEMPYPQISPESIVAHRPDVILELLPERDLSASDRAALTGDWQEMSTVPAVRHGRIYFLDDDNALIPSPRYVEIINKVSRLLHPE